MVEHIYSHMIEHKESNMVEHLSEPTRQTMEEHRHFSEPTR